MEFVKISSKAFTALVANKIELQYLPCLSINYVAISKDLKKLPPQVCWIKMKTCYDQGCNDIGVVIATKLHHYPPDMVPSTLDTLTKSRTATLPT